MSQWIQFCPARYFSTPAPDGKQCTSGLSVFKPLYTSGPIVGNTATHSNPQGQECVNGCKSRGHFHEPLADWMPSYFFLFTTDQSAIRASLALGRLYIYRPDFLSIFPFVLFLSYLSFSFRSYRTCRLLSSLFFFIFSSLFLYSGIDCRKVHLHTYSTRLCFAENLPFLLNPRPSHARLA